MGARQRQGDKGGRFGFIDLARRAAKRAVSEL